MSIGERIKNRREALGMTQEELALKLGYSSRSSINKIESNERNLKQSKIKAIADALGTTPGYIMGWDEEKENNIIILDDYNYFEVPRFDSIAAGFGVIAESNPIGTDLLPFKCAAEAAETMTIKVTGDSMYPKIEDGDVIAVRKQTSVDSGTLAAVLIDSTDAVVKKITYGPDWIVLHSLNPEYMDREFRGPEVQRIRVMGKVTKIIKEV